MPKEIQILPPIRTRIAEPKALTITASVPTLYRGGPISSRIDEWVWNKQSRAIDALTRVNASEAALLERQTAVVLSKIKRDDALFLLQEAPERRGHELAVRRCVRANEMREVQHHYEINEQRRREEWTLSEAKVTHAKATLTHARTVAKDAEQQFEAQCKYGHTKHQLTHAREVVELVKADLEEAECRALIRRYMKGEAIEDFDRDAKIEEEVDALYDQVVTPKK